MKKTVGWLPDRWNIGRDVTGIDQLIIFLEKGVFQGQLILRLKSKNETNRANSTV